MGNIRSSIVFSFAEKYLSLVLSLVGTMVLSRLLTPSDTGVYSLAAVWAGIAQVFRDLGVSQYIIQEKDLTMIFPDKRINNGQNFVKKDQRIVIPSNCGSYQDKNGNCWFEVSESDDDLTLIFSRDKIDDLPNSATDDGTVTIKKAVLAEVKSGSRQQFSKTNPNVTTVQFTNLNRNDNEELIIETKVRHQ